MSTGLMMFHFHTLLMLYLILKLRMYSYMVDYLDLNMGQYRLLQVDNPLAIPVRKDIRVLVTATDVLHSFAVPSFGIKIDAIPGRLNQVFIYSKREGVAFGQCSELCGINHYAMPIMVYVI